jgi:hypothetical protein
MAGVSLLHHHSAQAPRLFSRGIHPRSVPRFFTTIVENELGAKAERLRTPSRRSTTITNVAKAAGFPTGRFGHL